MPTTLSHVTISLLPDEVTPSGRAFFRSRIGDIQFNYRCHPNERTRILRAASKVGLTGAEFTRHIMLQVASMVLLDHVDEIMQEETIKASPVRLDPNLPPGVKR